MIHSLDDLASVASRELNLLSGAIGYFLELDDAEPDLKTPDGFEDDRQVANIVFEAIGRPELVVETQHAVA